MYALQQCVVHTLRMAQLRDEHEYGTAIYVCLWRAGKVLSATVRNV
jgi:hypothetical protein